MNAATARRENLQNMPPVGVRGKWRRDWPMARLSTWGVGGKAKAVFWPDDINALAAFIRAKGRDKKAGVGRKEEEKIHLIGLGSNLLARDGGVSGVVVRTAPGLAKIRGGEDGAVYAEAGASCARLARFCAMRGLSGGGFFCGIPGTVGGALAMNAGCFGAQTWDFVERVIVVDKTSGVLRERGKSFFTAAYRRVRPRALFAAAYFRFKTGVTTAAARAEIAALLARRKAEQPIGEASAGSVFCNPPGDFAARLIDKCGLKGAFSGAARVSEKHANFIVAARGATAADVEKLIRRVRRTVRAKTGVFLYPEVSIIGEAR